MRLSREKIQRMIDASGVNIGARRGGGGSGAGGGGGVSSQWVDEHYVSKEFFARLFTINGTDENDDDVVVEPNDLDTTIKNIQMMVGAWTEQYLSALGLSDGGSGGGGAIALQDLVNVEYVGTPSGGQILKYNGTTGKWYNADEGGGNRYLPLTGGTMTGQIKTSFKEAVATGSYYSEARTIPDLVTDVRYSSGVMGSAYITTDYTLNNITVPTRWYNYLWLPHRTGGVNGGASGDNTNYGSLLLSGMTASGLYLVRFHNGSIAELRNLYAAEQLQTTRALWGQDFNGTANVSGDMTDVGSITANGNMTIGTYNGSFVKLVGTSYSFGIHLGSGGTNRGLYDFTSSLDKWLLYFDASNTIMNYGNVGIGTASPGAKLDVDGQLRATTYLSCHNVVGEHGTAGWVCFAIVAVSNAWATQPLKFKVSQRGRLGGEITLRFAGVDAASNTTVEEFSYTGNIRAARVVRNGANFSLYIQKHEKYDDIAISLVNLGTFMSSKVTVTWTNSLSSSDPGGTAATCRYYFSNTAYMEWDETNSAVHFVNAGVYSDTFVSALGANSSGGGGGVNLNTLLTSLNSTSLNPATVSNKVLVNSSGTWTWQDYIAGGGGGSSVTSVGLSMPTGFSITGTNPITGSGTFTVTANGTIVPNLNADKLDGYEASGLFETLKNSTASGHTKDIEIKIGNTTKYLTVGYATSAGSATTAGSASTAGSATTAESCTGNAATASKLGGNASGPFRAWGNTFWNNGVPQSVSGDMSNVGNITAMTESNNYTKVITGFHSLTLRHNGSNGGHLDFFWNGASSYTSRIIEGASKRLDINDTIFVFHANSSSNAGCVGIGTTNPGYTLNVNGYTYTHRLYLASGVYLEYDNNGGVRLVGAGFYADTFVSALGANSSSGGGGIDLNTMWNALENSASGHSIGTNASRLSNIYATTGKITSINANEIGVGGFASGYQFSVTGDSSLTGFVEANGNFYVRDYAAINTAVDQNYRLKVSGNTLFDGRVGIGEYKSSYKLYVSGTTCTSSLKVNNTYEFVINWDNDEFFEVGAYNRDIHAIGSWYGSWRGASDIRKKNVVSKVDVDVAQIAELPIFNFTWKNSTDKDIYLGTSAQEVKKLFPSAVSVMSDGMLGMAYGETALAAAVMTARKVVDHEERIKRLERENEQLRKELAAVQTTPNPS